MEYYGTDVTVTDDQTNSITSNNTSPQKPAEVSVVGKKRKRDDGAPHLFYSSESLRCSSTMTVEISMFQDRLAMNLFLLN